MNSGTDISRKEFFDLLGKGPSAALPPDRGKADWDEIYAELKKTKAPMNVATIYKDFVKGVVTRYRAKNKLQEWAREGKCLMVYEHGMYWFYFGRLPPGMRAKLEEMKKAQEEPSSS